MVRSVLSDIVHPAVPVVRPEATNAVTDTEMSKAFADAFEWQFGSAISESGESRLADITAKAEKEMEDCYLIYRWYKTVIDYDKLFLGCYGRPIAVF